MAISKTEALVLRKLLGVEYGGKHVPDRVVLLSPREQSAGISLAEAGVVRWHSGDPVGEPSDYYPYVTHLFAPVT